jgi:hypothetical protein
MGNFASERASDMGRLIASRLREPSTWAGVSVLLALAGVSSEQVQAIAHAGAAVAGAVAVLLPEGKAP